MVLAKEVFEDFKTDFENNDIRGHKYLDTWHYEDEYSHSHIEYAREEFIKLANEFLESSGYPYVMKNVCENAMLCSKETGEIIR